MHQSLGGWPRSIGERGFPPALVTHGAVTVSFFQALFLSLVILPIPIFVCLVVQRWRRFVVYFVAYAISFVFPFCLCCLLRQRRLSRGGEISITIGLLRPLDTPAAINHTN